MPMQVKRIPVGVLVANCYLVYNTSDKEAVVIDPGAEGNKIISVINELELKVRYIINTHGHMDHVGANDYVKQSTGAKVLMHEADAKMLSVGRIDAQKLNKASQVVDQILTGEEEISCGGGVFKVLPTPGHTPGGISLSLTSDKLVFTGDTLFKESIGRTDFPGGSYDALIEGIRKQLFTLPDETVVYPGHGLSSTIGHEKAYNPFLS